MKRPATKKTVIYLSLDQEIFKGYFNSQDPTPMYKRQLSYEFEQYIMNCIRAAKRDSTFNYKISYRNENDKQYAEPLAYAIRRHFGESRSIAISSFEKFKKRTYVLLFASLAVVLLCQGFLPLLLSDDDHTFKSGLTNSLDVLCWVILWKPIERLIFYWNPFLKDISIMTRLENAEVVVAAIED